MAKFKHVTLALDLSLSAPGFAIVAVTDEGLPILLEKSHVKTNAKESHGFRLIQIAAEIERCLKDYEPAHVVRERGFSRFPATTQALFKVVGVSDLVAHDIGGHIIEEIAPTSVKKAVTGNGKASKEEVADAVLRTLQIEQPNFFATDDESDATAVGLAYLMQKKLITK